MVWKQLVLLKTWKGLFIRVVTWDNATGEQRLTFFSETTFPLYFQCCSKFLFFAFPQLSLQYFTLDIYLILLVFYSFLYRYSNDTFHQTTSPLVTCSLAYFSASQPLNSSLSGTLDSPELWTVKLRPHTLISSYYNARTMWVCVWFNRALYKVDNWQVYGSGDRKSVV